jgi:hypothetical protein
MATAILRHPRTLNELRQHEAALTDPDVILLGSTVHVVRLKRLDLPNYYDDIVRSDYRRKDWKHLRKTQYHSV